MQVGAIAGSAGGYVMGYLFNIWDANPFMHLDALDQLMLGGFAFGAVGSFSSVNCFGKEVKNGMAFLTVEFINWHRPSLFLVGDFSKDSVLSLGVI